MMIQELPNETDKVSIVLPIETPQNRSFLLTRNYLTNQRACLILSKLTKRDLHFDLNFTFWVKLVTFDVKNSESFCSEFLLLLFCKIVK